MDSAVPLRGLSNTCSGSRQSGTSRQEIPDDALRLGRAATVDTTMCIDCGVLFAVGVIALADAAYLVSNYGAGGISATAGVIGGTISLTAGVKMLGRFSPAE